MLGRRRLETAGPTPRVASAHQDAGEAPAADTPQPTDSAPRAASNDEPRARTVTATRSWPVSELIVAMMVSVLFHTACFIVFVATAGFRPGPPWVVFAADPEAVDEIVIGAPSPKTTSVRTAPAVATREPASPPKPRPSRPLSAPSATSPPTPAPPIESGSPLDQLVARPADGERASTPPRSADPSPIPPSEPVTRVSEPTPTPPAEIVARIPEPPRETPVALTDLPSVFPAVSATLESESPSRSASARATATAAAPVLPPIPEPRPSRQLPALGLPTSEIAARAPLPAPAPTTEAPPDPEPSEKTAQLPSVGPPADEGLSTSAGLIPPPAPVSGGDRVDAAPVRDVETRPPLKAPRGVPSPQAEPTTAASAQRQSVDSRSASPKIAGGVNGGGVSGEAADRVERSSGGTDDTIRQSGAAAVRGTPESTRVAPVARTLQPSESERTPGGGAAERPETQSPASGTATPSPVFDLQQNTGTPPARATQPQGGAIASPGPARPGAGDAGPQRSRGPGAFRVVAPRDGLTLGAEDAPIVVIEGSVEDAEDTTVWLVANGYRTPVRVRDGWFRHAMPVLERTTRLWIEAKAAASEPPRKSGEITVVNTAPGPVSVLAIESPLNSGEQLQVTASWRPLADRFDGVINGIPLHRFDAGRDVEPSTFFYMRHSGAGVFSFIVRGRGDAPSSTVSTRLYHLLNGHFSVRDVRSVPIGLGASGIAARILFPFGVEWNQSEWFTGRAEGSDTITQFRFPEAVGWTERRIDLR
jgi:hypothetical protein